MTDTFTLRDTRLARLAAALAALGEGQDELRARLQAEVDALNAAGRHTSDRAALLITTAWLWATTPVLLPVEADPLLAALGDVPVLDADQAAAIDALPRAGGTPPPDFLEQVRAAFGNNELVFAELVAAAYRAWLAQPLSERASPFDEVAVLLPLRLETLFDPPGSAFNDDPLRWKLSLRALPDEAAIRRDNPHVSAGEQAALERFWRAVQLPDSTPDIWLAGPEGQLAWASLCNQVAPPRAAWLVTTLFPEADGSVVLPAAQQGEPLLNRVGGMPAALEVWAMVGEGNPPQRIGRLPADQTRQIDQSKLHLPLPQTQFESDEARAGWWGSWPYAQAAGLGDSWPLDEGLTPDTLTALYVVGLSDETPTAHFQGQVDAGELGLLPLGAPTNTIAGEPAAPLAKDAASWYEVVLARLRGEKVAHAAEMIAQHLAGDPAALQVFPGSQRNDDTGESQRLLHALWPALWGHWLRDVWQMGEEAERTAVWAYQHLLPEGPLLPIRISEQPYGLLPTTALSAWLPAADERSDEGLPADAELRMARRLALLRDEWAAAARQRATVVGQPTAHWLDLLGRDANSQGYIWREFLHLDAFLLQYRMLGVDPGVMIDQARRFYEKAIDMMDGRDPLAFFLASGYWRPSRLPLVQPRHMPYRIERRIVQRRAPLTEILPFLFDGMLLDELFGPQVPYRDLPDSLLLRLLIYAVQVVAPLRAGPMSAPTARMLQQHEAAVFDIAGEFDQEAWWREGRDRRGRRFFTIELPAARRTALERGLRATLDSAAHRLDPWITGLAWQRLKVTSQRANRDYRLGVYGWLEGPFLGNPGPTNRGRLHAPSYNQALAGLVLRDTFLTQQGAGARNEAGDSPWQMNLSSPTVRLAEALASEVRLGFHIHEIVGRSVETIIDNHQKVKELRTNAAYAMRPERSDPNQVCNGLAALDGLLAGDAAFPLNETQAAGLRAIKAALDSYGDLLLADGVLQLVNRQPERAAELMDAASGFSSPPTFEFIRTPPSGYQLETTVFGALPFVDGAALALDAHPLRLAEPSLAAFIETTLAADWAWQAFDADSNLLGSVTLAELGLGVLDTLPLSDALLGQLAQQKLALPAAQMRPPREQQLARQLLTVFGNRPAAGRDLVGEQAAPASDAAILAELQARYDRLHAACQAMIDRLANAADDAEWATALRQVLCWGVVPVAEPADEAALLALLLGSAAPETATPLATLAQRAAQALATRLAASPPPAAPPTTKALRAEPPVDTLAHALAALATADGKFSILAGWDAAELSAATSIALEQPKPTLDERWLTVVAAVRPPLARLEALQLELAAFSARTSAADDDPWQAVVVQGNLDARGDSIIGLAQPRLNALYGSEASWAAPRLALAMIDAFSEAVPLPQRATSAAFGFNAPAARPPQALLLAVPPRSAQIIDPALLASIVHETRLLAQARSARLEDLSAAGRGAWHSVAPSMWLQSSGPGRVHLENWPLP